MEPRDGQLRYLVHFGDGGAGMRWRDRPLEVGDGLTDGGVRYRVMRVEPAPNPMGFGHAWAEPDTSEKATGGGCSKRVA